MLINQHPVIAQSINGAIGGLGATPLDFHLKVNGAAVVVVGVYFRQDPSTFQLLSHSHASFVLHYLRAVTYPHSLSRI